MGTTEAFTVTVLSQAPPEQVYALLEDGAHWSAWAGPTVTDSRWETPGDPVGGVGAIRVLGSWPLASHDEIVIHDPPRKHAYATRTALPMRDYQGEVTLDLTADGGTRIEWHVQFVAPIPWTGQPLRRFSERVVMSVARHLALAAAVARPAKHSSSQPPRTAPTPDQSGRPSSGSARDTRVE